ncbi:heptaprenyl diphosphate synthase component II [Bacillus massiliglaciei]|uniref:heptaprenyl diphosphate synthase component II n=1 Tax=Bacillus massiliglaciei TaxID=1816693 RepID=UPI000A83201B|nr:heptaprenyl diphosphate synthase component II [Bacillus massiliglaciei]
MKYRMMYSFLNTDLQLIEKELEAAIEADSPVLTEASLHLLQSGGKRIRPILVLLAAKFGDYNIHIVKHVAATLELIHTASLIHDDVVDEADLRRGAATIKAKWDNRVAMYTGDYIFARALEIMSAVENPLAHQILADTMVELCLGEIEQIKDKFNFDQNLRVYFRRIKRKTALLIASSCQLGAISAGVEEEVHRNLFKFGYYVGMSFQITDDILDFTASEEVLGKPAGSDLLQGNITLPVLIAMRNEELKKLITEIDEETSKERMAVIIDAIKASGAIEEAADISDQYLAKAFAVLDNLPSNKARRTLGQIAKNIGKRKF